jgi:hypothetical protein
MRHTQPLTAEEQRIDLAMRKEHRSHAQQDAALSSYRLAQRVSVIEMHKSGALTEHVLERGVLTLRTVCP